MKGITLITPRGLTYEETAPVLKAEFKDLKIESDEPPKEDEEGYLYIGKAPKSLVVYFSPSDRLREEDGFDNSELKRIPFEPFSTDVSFRLYSIACRTVKAVLTLCPNLYICDDEEGFLGAAAEFIEKHSE